MPKRQNELMRVFVLESSDRINELEGLVLEMEEDPGSRVLQDQFMRAAHTLKGSSGIVGLSDLSDLVHTVESVVQCLRDKRIPASPELFDRLSNALDLISKSLSDFAAGEKEPASFAEMRREIESWLSDFGATTKSKKTEKEMSSGFILGEYDQVRIGVLQNQGKHFYQLEIIAGKDQKEPVEWGRDTLGLLRKMGIIITTNPSFSNFDSVNETRKFMVLFATDVSSLEVYNLLASSGAASSRVEVYRVDGEREQDKDGGALSQNLISERTVRVELTVLDELLRLVGELMINRDRFDQVASEFTEHLGDSTLGMEIDNSASHLGHLTSDLQDAIMRARMVPVGRVFRRIKRQVRRASRELGFSIPLKTLGENTELDKSLVDALSEPLEHFAYGIAMAQESDNNTYEEGILLKAERRWNQIELTLSYYGGAPLDQEISHLQNVLAKVSGRLDLTENPSGTTNIVISLPLTLAIIRVMMARVGEEVYAFPIQDIREIERIRSEQIAMINGSKVVELRDKALSLLFLRDYFDIPTERLPDKEVVVVLDSKGIRLGVVVDDLIGIREVVLKPLNSRFTQVRTISGSAILGDEQIALILDAEALVEEAVDKGAPTETIIQTITPIAEQGVIP